MVIRAKWLAGILCVVLPLQVFADSEGAFQYLQEEAQVVTAAQHPQKLSEAPASAYVITAEDIERNGYRTLAEALQSLPGIYSSNDRNYSYLWFRGFGRPSDYNDRILLQVDGHRMNDGVYSQALVGEEFSVDMKAVDHIEVIKGPASALYGDNAFFGVIDVVTKNAKTAPQVEVSAEGGSYDTHKESLGMARAFQNGANAYIEGSYRNMKGQDLYYPQFSSINNGVAAGSDGENNSTFIGKLDYAGFTLEGNVGSRTKHIPTASFQTVFDDPGTRTTDLRSFIELRSEHQLLPAVQLTTRFYSDRYDYSGDYISANSTPPPDTVDGLDFASSRSYGEEVRTRLTPWGSVNALTIGEEYDETSRAKQQSYNEGTPPPYLVDVNTPYDRWATYIQQEWQPYSALSVTAGGRYDYYQTIGKSMNPRIALVHRLWQDGTLKATYGSAFRAPSPYETSYADDVSYAANPNLLPEKITSYELTGEQQFPGHGMVSISGYENRVKNLIDETTLSDGEIQFQNVSEVKAIGIELYSKWAWNKTWSGFAGYDLQNTREVSGAPLSNSPVHSGSAGLSAWIEPTRTTVSLGTFFVSDRRTYQQTTLPATALLNVTLRQQSWAQGPTLYASIYNLLNTAYSVPGGAEHVQDAIPQDGRNFIAGLEYKFR